MKKIFKAIGSIMFITILIISTYIGMIITNLSFSFSNIYLGIISFIFSILNIIELILFIYILKKC